LNNPRERFLTTAEERRLRIAAAASKNTQLFYQGGYRPFPSFKVPPGLQAPEKGVAFPAIQAWPGVAPKAEVDALFAELGHWTAPAAPAATIMIVIDLIQAMIEGGVDTGPRIVGLSSKLGFDRGHSGMVLTKAAASGDLWFAMRTGSIASAARPCRMTRASCSS
jgi:hypothetical protein